MQLALTTQSWCYFIFYTSKGIIIHRVQSDEPHWHKLETKILNFYFEYLLNEFISCPCLWKVLGNIGKYLVTNHFMSLIFLPLKKSENQRFLVFRRYNKTSGMKQINTISSLHLKVPQKVTGILLNFYTELAFGLDQTEIKFIEWTTQAKKRV